MKKLALAGFILACCIAAPVHADPKLLHEAWTRMSRIQTLVEYFYMEAGFYPNSLEELEQLINSKAVKGAKPVSVPKDPATNQPFSYTLDKTGRHYILTVVDSSKYPEGKPLLTAIDWGFLADLAELRRYEQVVRHTSSIIKAVATQVELYAKDHQGQFPASMDDLMPKYMTKFPTDPLTNKNFTYTKLPTGYVVSCPNPERYGFKTFQYSSSGGMELVQIPPKGGAVKTTAPTTATTPAPKPEASETPTP
jgi:hypothetical protein